MDDIPKEVLIDCAHLVKANSIQGEAGSWRQEASWSRLGGVGVPAPHRGGYLGSNIHQASPPPPSAQPVLLFRGADVAHRHRGCLLGSQQEEFQSSEVAASSLPAPWGPFPQRSLLWQGQASLISIWSSLAPPAAPPLQQQAVLWGFSVPLEPCKASFFLLFLPN